MGQKKYTTAKQNGAITGGYNKQTQTLHHHRITIHFQSNSTGKCTIDLTSVRGLKNVLVKSKEFELIKSGHLAIEVLIEDTQQLKTSTKV